MERKTVLKNRGLIVSILLVILGAGAVIWFSTPDDKGTKVAVRVVEPLDSWSEVVFDTKGGNRLKRNSVPETVVAYTDSDPATTRARFAETADKAAGFDISARGNDPKRGQFYFCNLDNSSAEDKECGAEFKRAVNGQLYHIRINFYEPESAPAEVWVSATPTTLTPSVQGPQSPSQ